MAGGYTSTLTMRLIAGVTGPAKGVRGALAGLDGSLQRTAGAGGLPGLLAGGAKLVAMVGGLYALGRTAKSAVTAFAELDRRLERILITADASHGASAATLASLKRLAMETAMPLEDVATGLETLVAAGKSLDQAMAMLPAVIKTAQASGAATDDIANSARAVADSFGITAGDMQSAFDIMNTAGKAGMFELKDMAQYLPSLTPAMANLGYKGLPGLRKLAAMLQTVREQTGESGEAATRLESVFANMFTSKVLNSFSGKGIDLIKEFKQSLKDGSDWMEVFLDLTQRATKGDMTQLMRIFGRKETAEGVRALLMLRDHTKRYMDEIAGAAGSVESDLARVTKGPAAKIQLLQSAWENFLLALGSGADTSGVTRAIEAVTAALADVSTMLDEINGKGLLPGLTGEGVQKLLTGDLGISTPASKAYRETFETLTGGKTAPFGGIVKRLLPGFGADVEGAIAAARTDALRTIQEEAARKYPFATGRGPRVPINRSVPTSREAEANPWRTGYPDDYTFGADGRFRDYNTWMPNTLRPAPPVPMRKFWPAAGATPLQTDGGVPRPRLDPRRHPEPAPGTGGALYSPEEINRIRIELQRMRDQLTTQPIELPPVKAPSADLSDAGAETMRSFHAGLTAEMAGIEAEVSAFAGRLRSQLSFTANPKVNATVTQTTVNRSVGAPDAPASAKSASYEMGKEASARLRGGYADQSYA